MKTCFNYQVLAVVLYQQLQVAYRSSDAEEQFDTWANKKCQDSCWHIGFELRLKYLIVCAGFQRDQFQFVQKVAVFLVIMVFCVQSPKLSTVCYNTFY